ncbi:MAG: membrane protein insertion efficiency factor YidD [Cyanobacteria bacterium]|nr:membrane protein insertion efficiency factor YidD [Cyanobacteriota bacterium]
MPPIPFILFCIHRLRDSVLAFGLGLIKVYQVSTGWLPKVCRYHPSCSHYVAGALQSHGLVVGGWLGATRILRCHPFSPGGLDPVPDPPPHIVFSK